MRNQAEEHDPANESALRLAHEGDRAKLRSPFGEELPVMIEAKDGDVLLLSLLIKGEAELSDHLGESVLLECASSRGLLRFHGDAQLEDGHFVRFHLVDSPEVVQRRRHVRVFAPQPVSVERPTGEQIGAHTVNVSGGGMLLSGSESLLMGDTVRFSLHLDQTSDPVEGSASVVRELDGGMRAVAFDHVSDDDRERLIHFIFARLRTARARTRDGER